MIEQDARKVLDILHGLTIEDIQALDTSKYSLISRMLRSWCLRKPIRQRLLKKQGGVCALSGVPLSDNGKDAHLDHIWTIKQAVAAVEAGASVGETYKRLWDENNLRAVTPAENYKRNRGHHDRDTTE
jgi:hypothetical protein